MRNGKAFRVQAQCYDEMSVPDCGLDDQEKLYSCKRVDGFCSAMKSFQCYDYAITDSQHGFVFPLAAMLAIDLARTTSNTCIQHLPLQPGG